MKKPNVKQIVGSSIAIALIVVIGIVVIACVNNSTSSSNKENAGTTVSQEKTLYWPTGGLGGKLPAPKSQVGEISEDDSNYFTAVVEETSYADYKDFVNGCMEKGFDYDYDNDDDYFDGEDMSGNKLSITYDESKQQMNIDLRGNN